MLNICKSSSPETVKPVWQWNEQQIGFTLPARRLLLPPPTGSLPVIPVQFGSCLSQTNPPALLPGWGVINIASSGGDQTFLVRNLPGQQSNTSRSVFATGSCPCLASQPNGVVVMCDSYLALTIAALQESQSGGIGAPWHQLVQIKQLVSCKLCKFAMSCEPKWKSLCTVRSGRTEGAAASSGGVFGVTVWWMHHVCSHHNLLLSEAVKAAGGEPWNFLDLKHSDWSLTWFINQHDGANVLHRRALCDVHWLNGNCSLSPVGVRGRKGAGGKGRNWVRPLLRTPT